jgi:rhomboid protease GluP
MVLIALNFLVFGVEIYLGGTDNNSVLLSLGAAYGPYLRRGEYWRLVMPIFLHSGWAHILGNTLVLFILGRIMERIYGYGRYAAIYVVAGMGGALLSMTVSKNISVGASGAILGIAGALFTAGFLHSESIPPRWRGGLGWRLLPFVAIVLVSGLTDRNIDNWGHVGGLMTGALVAYFIPPYRPDSLEGEPVEPRSEAWVALPLAIVVLAGSATAQHFLMLQKMDRLLTDSQQFDEAHQTDRALQNIQQALRLAPRQEQPHEAMGRFYLTEKKFDEAIHEFQEAIRLSGGDDYARLQLGLAYELKGDPNSAQPIFESVLGENPQTDEGRELLAGNETTLGDLYSEQKHYGEAITLYRQALLLDPDLPEAQNNLAWLFATCDDLKLRDPKEALEHAERAVALTQWKDPNSIDTLAEAHFVNGEFQQAVEIQRKAIALEPGNKELQEHMERYRRAAAI